MSHCHLVSSPYSNDCEQTRCVSPGLPMRNGVTFEKPHLGKTKKNIYPRMSNNRHFWFWASCLAASSSKDPGSKGARGKEACSNTFQKLVQNYSVAVMTHALSSYPYCVVFFPPRMGPVCVRAGRGYLESLEGVSLVVTFPTPGSFSPTAAPSQR